MSQSSGKWQGKARIQGGHRNLRHATFMPVLVAIRHNADMKAATTAVMRKLLVLANALLRHQRKWVENMA
ncbi:transposase [Yoonia sp. MH D7]